MYNNVILLEISASTTQFRAAGDQMYESAITELDRAIAALKSEMSKVLVEIKELERTKKTLLGSSKGIKKARKSAKKVAGKAAKRGRPKKAAKKKAAKRGRPKKAAKKKVLSPEQKAKAQSKRMKAYWAKKRKANPKPKVKPGRKQSVKGQSDKVSSKMLGAWAEYRKKKEQRKSS